MSEETVVHDQSVDDRVFLPELAEMLGRTEKAIRTWIGEARKVYALLDGRRPPVEEGFLPDELWPQIEEEGRRRMYWTTDQVKGMREFAEAKAGRRGWQAMRST
jgi:hypothetical protein